MKKLLHNSDETMMEKASHPHDSFRHQHSSNCIKLFKWFLVFNFLILLCFLAYALCGLYRLSSAMRSSEKAVEREERYFDNSSTATDDNDFREWRKSIQQGIDRNNNMTRSGTNNLDVLLDTIASVMKNFANNTSTPRNTNIVVANLTDFEMRLLQEYAKMRTGDGGGSNATTRFTRTVKSSGDESACNLRFAFGSKNEPYRVVILTETDVSSSSLEPTEMGEGQINISNAVNTYSKNKLDKHVRQCSFKIVYEPNKNY